MWRLIGTSDRTVHAVTGRAKEWQVGGWETDTLSHLGALLQGHDKLNQYASDVYIILTTKSVFKKLKLFIFSEADDQEDFFYCYMSLNHPFILLFLLPSSHMAGKLELG